MKNYLRLAAVFCLMFLLAGCSGVSEAEYDQVVADKSDLEAKIVAMEKEINNLEAEIESVQFDQKKNLLVRDYLLSTYDAYRYMMLYVTTEVVTGSLTQGEWENYITKAEYPAPNFEDVKLALAE